MLKWNKKKVKDLNIKNSINFFYKSINKGAIEDSNEERPIKMNVLDFDFYVYIERMKKDLVIKCDAFYFGLPSDEFDNLDSMINKKEKQEKKNKTNETKNENVNEKKDFEKIKNEFGVINNIGNKRKFIRMFTLRSRPKIDSNTNNDLNNKNKSTKKVISLNINDDEEQQHFIEAQNNLEKFNILKNKKMFDFNKFKNMKRRNTFSETFNSRKEIFQSEKKLPLNLARMNIPGMDNLNTENLLIKAIEKEKDTFEIKLFDEMVLILNSRKILTFKELFGI